MGRCPQKLKSHSVPGMCGTGIQVESKGLSLTVSVRGSESHSLVSVREQHEEITSHTAVSRDIYMKFRSTEVM